MSGAIPQYQPGITPISETKKNMSTQNAGLATLATAFDTATAHKPARPEDIARSPEQEELRREKAKINVALAMPAKGPSKDDLEDARTAPAPKPANEQKPAPVGKLEIPVLDEIRIYHPYTGRVSVKFNVGDFGGVPKGISEFKHQMDAEARLKANLALARTIDPTLADQNRVPGRKHDTALGVLGGKKVKLVRPSFMLELKNAARSLEYNDHLAFLGVRPSEKRPEYFKEISHLLSPCR